jgi:uncharacterized repeat protein (TIGR02543 family)
MKKRFFIPLCLLTCSLISGLAFAACEESEDTGLQQTEYQAQDGENGKSAYELYKEKYGYNGTEDEWLEALVNGELAETVQHTVTFQPDNGEEDFTQQIQHGEKAERPEQPERDGYIFNGWIYDDGVEEETWSFNGYSITKDITLTAKWDYLTYELPIINIDTQGASINSKVEYTDMTFSLENCDDELSEITGGIRLRGNSTRGYPKKPYRIKFDKKQSLFGLEKAKSWVLLADYLDPSALHNYTAFSLANEMPGLAFTPSPHKVNVYLNGNFAGLYTLCEQVQENEGRMNIELDEITEDMVDLKDFNFFICMDKSVLEDSDSVLDETYFYLEEYDRYFELKYPEKDQFVSEEQFESFFAQLKEYVSDIMYAFKNKDVETIKREANLNSLIDYLIIDQIMGENDHMWKSFNMYYTNTSTPEENGKLNFGPVWDYDYALHTPWTGKPNQDYTLSDRIIYSNVFFQAMANVPEFYGMIKERYTLYASNALGNYIEQIDDIVASMDESVKLNEELWYSFIEEEDLSQNNIDFLIAWLEHRKELLDEKWLLTDEE